MEVAINAVRQFHRKIGADLVTRLPCGRSDDSLDLKIAGLKVAEIARTMKSRGIDIYKEGDPRVLRAHLILEEAAEFIIAMANQDEEQALDGLADLTYVTFGSALALNLPLEDGFEEVHSSNMSKSPPAGDVRAQSKGTTYRPPNMSEVLRRYHGS